MKAPVSSDSESSCGDQNCERKIWRDLFSRRPRQLILRREIIATAFVLSKSTIGLATRAAESQELDIAIDLCGTAG